MNDLKKKILNRVRPIDIFNRYIDEDIRFGKSIKSPLRVDKNPSFNIYRNETGNVYYKDFAGDRGDCFEFVMQLFGCDFKTALEIVANDFNVLDFDDFTMPERKIKIPKLYIKKRKKIEYLARDFRQHELLYWMQFGINKSYLEEYKVKAIEWFKIGGFTFQSTSTDPIFAYIYDDDGVKLYRPLTANKKYKFVCNTKSTDIFGINQITEKQEIVIICAGQKDVLSLYSNTGIRGIALSSEKAVYYEDLHLKLLTLSTEIAICYDIDKTGQEAEDAISKEYGIRKIKLSELDFEGKDISDFFKDTSTGVRELLIKIYNYDNKNAGSIQRSKNSTEDR